MNPQRVLLVAAVTAAAVFLISIELHEYHYSFDPYSWAYPGIESDKSRSLWLQRRDLYRMIGAVSFTAAAVLSIGALMLRRRWRPS